MIKLVWHLEKYIYGCLFIFNRPKTNNKISFVKSCIDIFLIFVSGWLRNRKCRVKNIKRTFQLEFLTALNRILSHIDWLTCSGRDLTVKWLYFLHDDSSVVVIRRLRDAFPLINIMYVCKWTPSSYIRIYAGSFFIPSCSFKLARGYSIASPLS
jgi:hypothetical protein